METYYENKIVNDSLFEYAIYTIFHENLQLEITL